MQQQQMTNLDSSRDYILGMVSVVIPTYNQEGFVKETIDSVLAQDYPNMQIIITDDGSTDGTAQIIQDYAQQYPDKVVAVESGKNTGIPANFNRGLRQVKGEYIAWLGGDDLMLPGKISKQVELLQKRPDAVGCCHDAEVFVSPSNKILGVFSKLFNGKKGFREGNVELWFDANYFMLPSTMMIRSKAVPGHGFDIRLKYLNDWLLDVEIFRNGKCVVINEVLGKYRRHADNVTGNNQARDGANEEGLIALAILEARYPDLYYLIRRRRIVIILSAATKAYREGDSKKYYNYLKAAIRYGAIMHCVALFISLSLFGPYVSRQMRMLPFERSALYVTLSKLFKAKI